MANVDIAETTKKIHALLKELEVKDRQRTISAALTLLGDVYIPSPSQHPETSAGSGNAALPPHDPRKPMIRSFFDEKSPTSKIEELAVAARYREQHEAASSHAKEDFEQIFKTAKRNFDKRNYRRDIRNAKVAKLFNLGSENSLSYFGEQYVDALPNRENVAKLRRPKGNNVRKKHQKAK